MIADLNKMKPGVLFGRRAESALLRTTEVKTGDAPAKPASHPLAFAGLFLFTLLLYVRPNELFPDVFGSFSIMKIVAILTLIVYIGGKLGHGERLTVWPLEMSMLAAIVFLGVIFTPISAAPDASIELLTDTFFKVSVVFVLMLNLVDTRERLLRIMKLVVLCGTGIAAGSIEKFVEGKFTATIQGVGVRIEGTVGGIFGNPNDLAMALDLLLPLTIVLALTSKPAGRLIYSACAFVLVMGVVVTFSRGGFLGLAAAGGMLLWKLGRHNKLSMAMAAFAACGVLALSMPAGYSDRLFTIIHTEKDTTNSAQERQGEMKQAVEIASRHLVIGIGMGNYPFYSNHAIRAHNSYIELAAELGLAGLAAYLVLIFGPLRSMKLIERETSQTVDPARRELRFLAAGVHASIVGYLVCAVFSSAQYQWYLFYPVAYAVSLRRLYAASEIDHQKEIDREDQTATTQGLFWRR
jgi:O-antigen ligase